MSESHNVRSVRVLVVDDSRAIRHLLRDWLVPAGYDVTLAANGREAWDLSVTEQFDIVITDWAMPGMDGIELCWFLRAENRSHFTYLILITASDNQDRLIEALDAGADDFIAKPINPSVLRARVRAGERIITMQRQLMRFAAVDQLTRVHNRRFFFIRCQEEIARAQRTHQPLSILMMDIDHFKRVNDTYGHGAGDDALRACTGACKAKLRPTDVIGRLGGEEFAVLLPQTDLEHALDVAERLRETIAAIEIRVLDQRFGFTISIGAATVDLDAGGVDPSLARADAALYQAKQSGRNRVVAEGVTLVPRNPSPHQTGGTGAPGAPGATGATVALFPGGRAGTLSEAGGRPER